MKPGDLVTLKIIPNHHRDCCRIFNIPNSMEKLESGWIYSTFVDKLFTGEVGVVVELRSDLHKVRILSPRGILGWCTEDNLVEIGNEIETG